MQEQALIVFGKVPVPGFVKTRLAATIGIRASAILYRAFFRDSLASYTKIDADVRIYFSSNDRAIPDELVLESMSPHFQRGNDLGQRMSNAFQETFTRGYARVVIVGTDHPTLPTSYIERAFSELDGSKRVLIGPARDGGYYLLGLSAAEPSIFAGMTYGHPDVYRQTIERAAATGLEVRVLPNWYDVDDADDLKQLIRDVELNRDQCELTYAALVQLGFTKEM